MKVRLNLLIHGNQCNTTEKCVVLRIYSCWWQFYRNPRPNNSLTTLNENSTTDNLYIYQKLVTLIKI
jgi:hypothetical protein